MTEEAAPAPSRKTLPIEAARNIGPVVGTALRACGIATVGDLERVGWQEAWWRICQRQPGFLHLLSGYALFGAIENQDGMRLREESKAEIRRWKKQMQRDLQPGR